MRRNRVAAAVAAVATVATGAAAGAVLSPSAARPLGPVTQVGVCELPVEASYPDPAPASFSIGFGPLSEGARSRPGFRGRVAAVWTGRLGKSGPSWVPGTTYAWVSHARAEFTQRCRPVSRRGAARLGSLHRRVGAGEINCDPRGTRIVLRVRTVQQGGRRVGTHLSVVGRAGRVLVTARVVRAGVEFAYDPRLCQASSIP